MFTQNNTKNYQKFNDISSTTEPDIDYENQPTSLQSSRGDTGESRNSVASQFDPRTDYLIITKEAFTDELEPFMAWKYRKGVYPSIATIDGASGINSSYSGPDLPAKIHKFLKEYYNRAPNLKWLLLVGDSEIIPTRRLLNKNITGYAPGLIHNYSDSDYYYAALDSDWDDNSNQIYGETGEEDWVPELYVGRFPVNTETEVENVVNKTLTYEMEPPYGDWLRTSVQVGALMDRPNVIDDIYTYPDEGYDWYKDNARKVILKVREHLPENTINFTFFDYDKVYGGEYTKENDMLNESNLLPAFNLGASTVNFVSKGDSDGVKHYSGSGIGKIEYNSGYFFSKDTIPKLQNGLKLPLVYTSSCTSVNFTENDDSNLEKLITCETNGAIGLIGGTTETYRLEFYINYSSYGNWWLNNEFWRRFYSGEGEFRPGEILYNLKADYYLHYINASHNPHADLVYQPLYRTNFFAYNLLGDPEVPVYTDRLRNLNVQHPQNLLPSKRNHSMTIKVLDDLDQPVPDATVCLTGNGVYLVQKTDENGIAQFDLQIYDEGKMNITVTAHNFYYYDGEITIKAMQDLMITDEFVTFDNNPIPPGKQVNITVNVKNNGSSKLTDIDIHCFADVISDDYLISPPDLQIEDIPIGKIRNITFNWTPPEGSHNIIAIVDYQDLFFEFNENNNIAETMLIENIPPLIYYIPDQLMFEDIALIDALNLSIYTWDPDTLALNHHYYLDDKDPPEFNVEIDNSYVSLYPPLNWHGNASITVGVFDGTSYDTDKFIVTILPVNDPPVIADTTEWNIENNNITVEIDYIAVLEDHPVNISVLAYDYADNDTNLLFTTDSNLFKINNRTGEFIFTPANSVVGRHQINFTVDDGHESNNLAWRMITFEVKNINDPPFIEFIPPQYLTLGDTLELQVNVLDIDLNDTMQFRDNTELFEINETTGLIIYEPKVTEIGTHEIKIIVTDGNETDSIILTIEITTAAEDPLSPVLVVLCPVILVVIIVFILIQEHLKNKSRVKKTEQQNDATFEESHVRINDDKGEQEEIDIMEDEDEDKSKPKKNKPARKRNKETAHKNGSRIKMKTR
jgi:hypothetical protein